MLITKSPFLQQLIIFLMLAACVALTTSVVFVDVLWLHNQVGETSLTEILQAILLLACSALWLRCACKSPAIRGGCILVAGFYVALLIRELDYYFDAIRHGAWLGFALTSTAISLYYAWISRTSVSAGLQRFIAHPTAGYTFCGFAAVLVFSRLFGMSVLWQALLEEHYVMVVKSAVEEGSELLGYTLCAFSSAWYCLSLRRTPQMTFVTQKVKLSSPEKAWAWDLQHTSRH